MAQSEPNKMALCDFITYINKLAVILPKIMENNKKEKFKLILSKAKDYRNPKGNFSTIKSFDVEIIEIENEIEDSILFDSLEEATKLISTFAQMNTESEVSNNLQKLLSEKNINNFSEFRLKIITS